VTTAPVLGQPAAAFPVAPRSGRAEVARRPCARGRHRRVGQRHSHSRPRGARLHRSKSSVDPLVIVDEKLPVTFVSQAVHVSARQVRSGELVPDVISALATSGLPARRLIVEITESVLLDDSHVIEDLTVLRQLGVRVAVDDFGTGWSSLAYLVGMPVDVLKMDQYFLANVEHDPARRAMCRAVFSRPLEAEQPADGAWEAWGELPAPDPAMAAASPAESPAMPS
jgi:hypothetical protein